METDLYQAALDATWELDILHQLTEAEKAQQRAVVLAHDRYRSGLIDFLDVLDAERSLYTSQAHLAQGERALSQNLVRLYKALAVAGKRLSLGARKARGSDLP